MSQFQSADDRPDPSEQPLRARVPDHVSGGAFSTGVIVMTAQSEFILDFVQNLGRPHQIVSRVVMPHAVLPQLVDALHRNMDLYRQRWGELPSPNTGNLPANASPTQNAPANPFQPIDVSPLSNEPPTSGATANSPDPQSNPQSSESGSGTRGGSSAFPNGESGSSAPLPGSPVHGGSPSSGSLPGGGARQASAQEIYDELKIRDELLSGVYANAVMIGHGPHEFSFDFITNFYPHSAVSARVFLAAGQIPRLFDSLKGTWEQLRGRWMPPGGPGPTSPPPPSSGPMT